MLAERDVSEAPWPPPANDEVEQALLGAILADNLAYDRVSGALAPEHFADPIHGAVYGACGCLIGEGRQANAMTLKAYFENEEALSQVGGAKYLAQLQANYVTTIGVADYAKVILDCWARRQMLDIAGRMAQQARIAEIDRDASALVEHFSAEMASLIEAGQREGGLVDFQTLSVRVAEQSEAIRLGDVEPGIPTGLVDLDRLIGGLHRGDLIIVAGRPGMGKTALATKIAEGVASRPCVDNDAAGGRTEEPQPVAFFSLEMTAEAITRRIACSRAGVEYARTLQRNGLSQPDYERFIDALMAARALPLRVDGTPRLSPAQIRARALAMKRRNGLSLIVVDHLGHVAPPHRTNARHQDLGDITKALKATAKSLDVPVLLLCQLNRGVEGREDKRPTLADLRESGQIEEDADVVMFCYREEYYLARSEPKRREGEDDTKFLTRLNTWASDIERARGLGDVMVAKQRNGAAETVRMAFGEQFMRWADLARSTASEEAA